MSHHQQMLKSLSCSTAAFTYLHILYQYSLAQSPEIFSAFLPWTFCTDQPFFKPLKYPDNEVEIKPTSGALWPYSRHTLLPASAWDAGGSSSKQLCSDQRCCSLKRQPQPSASGPQVQQISFGIHGWIFPNDSMWTPEPGVALRGRSSLQVLQKLVLLCHLAWGSVRLLQDDTGTFEQRQTVLLELFLVNNMEIEIGNTSREWDYANSKIGLI